MLRLQPLPQRQQCPCLCSSMPYPCPSSCRMALDDCAVHPTAAHLIENQTFLRGDHFHTTRSAWWCSIPKLRVQQETILSQLNLEGEMLEGHFLSQPQPRACYMTSRGTMGDTLTSLITPTPHNNPETDLTLPGLIVHPF